MRGARRRARAGQSSSGRPGRSSHAAVRAGRELRAGTRRRRPCCRPVYGDKHAKRLYLLDAVARQSRSFCRLRSIPCSSSATRASRRRACRRHADDHAHRTPRTLWSARDPRSEPARFMLDRFVDRGRQAAARSRRSTCPASRSRSRPRARSCSAPSPTPNWTPARCTCSRSTTMARARSTMRPLDASYSDATRGVRQALLPAPRRHRLRRQEHAAAVRAARRPRRQAHAHCTTFELPGGRYRIADARDEQLLLMDDRSHYVVLDVSGDTPKLVKFLSATVGLSAPDAARRSYLRRRRPCTRTN